MKIVDTHFHLDLHKNEKLITTEIEKNRIYTIAVTNAPSVFFHTKILCENSKHIRAALGYHPEIIGVRPNEIELFKNEIQATRYIGEVGLDNSSANSTFYDKQKKIFSKIVEWCDIQGNKILTIHSRKAVNDVLQILGESFNGKVILHYYSGTLNNLKIAINRGYYFSVNFKMTQTKSGKEIISQIPIERILSESDYPFLENGMSQKEYLLQTVNEIGKIKGITRDGVSMQIYENMKTLLR